MSPEVALLAETWQLVKSHIHAKERLEIAEAMLQIFEEHVDISELEVYKNELDSVMKAAILSHYGDELDDEEDEWE